MKPKTSFAPWRARTRIALVVDCGSWIANVGRGSPCWFCRVGSWVIDREFVGCPLWCWVTGGCCGWRDMVLGCRCWVRWWRDRDKRQGWEMRDRGERESEMRDRDERWETEKRESNKILLLFYNTCYSAILNIELHCSSIAKKFVILLFSILQCIWFWGLKFQISLRYGISILQC